VPAWTIAAGGLAALIVLTHIGVYSRSMVAIDGEPSNMFPTTVCIAALAVFQFGLVECVRPVTERWLARRRPWLWTVAMNAVAMTVFTWHMTALVIAVALYQAAGGVLLRTPSAAWWAQRPLWIVLPGVILAGLVPIFIRFEKFAAPAKCPLAEGAERATVGSRAGIVEDPQAG